MQNFELQYSSALRNILENGIESKDRTNTGTLRLPDGLNLRLSPNVEFPALRGKKLNIRNSLIECIWMLKGLSNIKFLQENGVNYWNQWELNPFYKYAKFMFYQLNYNPYYL